MTEPNFIYNYERFDNAKEALEAFHNSPNIGYKHGIKFLDWLVWKITKPIESTPRWHKTIWDRVQVKFNDIRELKNIDVALDLNFNNGKDLFDLWMKWEVNNPNTGKTVENKRWIIDWLFDKINDDLKHTYE